MSDNYKQVVDLQPKASQKKEMPKPRRRTVAPQTSKKKKNKATEIDQIYNDKDMNDDVKKELSQIDRPENKNKNFFKQLSTILFLIIILLIFFYFFTNKNKSSLIDNATNQINQSGDWYSVQLANNETYYGFIRDISADPVVLENVYYNYNQISNEEDSKIEEKAGANIRLIKRGKEAHGPDGTMDIVRSQLMYMEVLSEGSKIRQAILKYEK